MAVQQTQNLPAPYIEQSIKDFLGPMGTAGATPSVGAMGLPSVAPESAFTDVARQQAGKQAGFAYDPTAQTLTAQDYGAGAGVASYEPYLTKAATYSDPANISTFYLLIWELLEQRWRNNKNERRTLYPVKHYNQELLEEEDMELLEEF